MLQIAPMDTLELFQRLALALAIGLLVGIERGWHDRDEQDGGSGPGIRTFSLVGLLGGVWGALYPSIGGVALGFGALGFAIAFTVFQWREAEHESSFSGSGILAGLTTFALGVFALVGNMAAAGAAGVAVAGIMVARDPLHNFLRRLTWPELRSAMVLLAMTFVLLPILPNRTIDPWDAINPSQLWLMTILIAAFSYIGYVAIRVAGQRRGLLYAGALGGVVSSTAVTLTFARLAGEQPTASYDIGAGITAAWAVSIVRVVIVATAVAPALLVPLAVPAAAAALVLLLSGGLLLRLSEPSEAAPLLAFSNPFDPWEVLRFGAFLAVVLFAAKLLSVQFGQEGLLPLAAISGLADVDPITLSTAQMTTTGLSIAMAVPVILVAISANMLAKIVLTLVFGGRELGMVLAASGVAAIGSGALIWWQVPV